MAVPLIIAGVGLAFSAYQAVQEAKKEREAKQAIENLERQELSNVAEGLQVSTLGSDLAREEAGRFKMSKVDALQADQRLLLGGLGRSEAGLTDLDRKIQADLDMQQKQIDQQVMAENQRIRQLQEQREIADVAALSSQITASNQNKMTAIGTGIQAVGMIGNTLGTNPNNAYADPASSVSVNGNGYNQTALNLYPQNTINPPATIQTQGLNYLNNPQFGYGGQGMFANPTIPNSNY
jgi:hypothetical protein